MKIQLLSVRILPTFVIVDDNGSLRLHPDVNESVVSGADWPNIVRLMNDAIAELQAAMDTELAKAEQAEKAKEDGNGNHESPGQTNGRPEAAILDCESGGDASVPTI